MEVDAGEDIQDKEQDYLALLRKGCTNQVIACCLEEELSGPTPHTYKFLLAAYLIQNSSDEARLLWMRLPVSVKSQLQSLWSVGRAILQHDFPNVYTSTPSTLQSLVLSAFQTRTFNMISVVYKSLSVTDFQTMTGVETRADVEEVVSHLGWRIAEDFVVPKKSEKSQSKTSVSLTELANYISFLENV